MAQATAPNGWTSSAVTDTSLRYNSGTGGGTGGTIAWSSWNFGGTFNANGFTLSVAQLPAHNHGVNDSGHGHGVNDSGHAHSYTLTNVSGSGASGGGGFNVISQTAGTATSTDGTGISIQSNTSGITTQNNGSGATITPSITTPQVKYIDHILAVKS
jgi:hypothetical protein